MTIGSKKVWQGQGARERPAEPGSGGSRFAEATLQGRRSKLGAPLILEAAMLAWQDCLF